MNDIELVVGDWSKDGHNQSDNFMIKSNLNKKELEKAYKKGVKIIGFDLVKEACEQYEVTYLTNDQCTKLSNSGLSIIDNLENGDVYTPGTDSVVHIWMPDEWVRLYLYFCKVGNPSFEYEFNENPQSIKIGGYGLYQ